MPEGQPPEDTLPARIREKAQTWLREDGWRVEPVSADSTIWASLATDEFDRKVVIGQKRGKDDQLLITAQITLNDQDAERVYKLSSEERTALLHDMQLELLRTDLEYEGMELPLKRISVSDRIIFDGLTKDAFLRRLSGVRKGILLIKLVLQRVSS